MQRASEPSCKAANPTETYPPLSCAAPVDPASDTIRKPLVDHSDYVRTIISPSSSMGSIQSSSSESTTVGVLCLDARSCFNPGDRHCHVWGCIAAAHDGIAHGIEFLVVKLALTPSGHEELQKEMAIYDHLLRVGSMLTERVRIPRCYGLYRETGTCQEDPDSHTSLPMLALVMSLEPGKHARGVLDESQWYVPSVRPVVLVSQLMLACRRDLQAAVEALHERGVCHLDLAPRNVLLNNDNTLTIIDFGQASLTTDEDARQEDLEALHTEFFTNHRR